MFSNKTYKLPEPLTLNFPFRFVFTLVFILLCSKTNAEFVSPDKIDLVDAPIDSVQKTLWKSFPVVVHRRTNEQLENIENSFDDTPPIELRYLSYQSIARTQGHQFASAIMEFTESYISNKNAYMSEIPEFGIYSQVSPILGCAIFKGQNGFIDPCNGVEFDFVGRVKNHPGYGHLRLTIPPHRIVDNKLEFLEDYKPQKITDFTPDIFAMDVSDIEKALYAIDYERLDILKQIISETPEVLSEVNSAGTNLLQMAAFHDTTLDYILSFGHQNVDHVNEAGYTALMLAVWNEKYENAEKLFAFGATPRSFKYKGEVVPSIYEFLVNDYLFDKETAEKIYQKLLEIEKNTRKSG